MEKVSLQMIQTLSTTIEAKDEYARGHSHRVAEYAALIANELGWGSEEIINLKYAHTYMTSVKSVPGYAFEQACPPYAGRIFRYQRTHRYRRRNSKEYYSDPSVAELPVHTMNI